MYDAGKIIAGLLIFLVLVTSPMWYKAATGTKGEAPELKYVTEEKACVADTEYMRALHMDLLNEWRDDVVRKDDREYHGLEGKVYEKSLSRTCMSCHSNKEEFCDRCHNYAGVSVYCWDCHVEPAEVK